VTRCDCGIRVVPTFHVAFIAEARATSYPQFTLAFLPPPVRGMGLPGVEPEFSCVLRTIAPAWRAREGAGLAVPNNWCPPWASTP